MDAGEGVRPVDEAVSNVLKQAAVALRASLDAALQPVVVANPYDNDRTAVNVETPGVVRPQPHRDFSNCHNAWNPQPRSHSDEGLVLGAICKKLPLPQTQATENGVSSRGRLCTVNISAVLTMTHGSLRRSRSRSGDRGRQDLHANALQLRRDPALGDLVSN